MTKNKCSFTITTKSNLFIGGSPQTFEIGGIDSYTVVDYEGKPFIPGSSLKGTLRFIAKENWENSAAGKKITEAYRNYLSQQKAELLSEGAKRLAEDDKDNEQKNIKQRIKDLEAEVSPAYLFGMAGFNQSPKLLFSDVIFASDCDYNQSFSIDSKNSISKSGQDLVAIPRTYKTIRPGIDFQGEILFQRMNQLEIEADVIEDFLEEIFGYLHDGYYRLGNSGSRGYGRVNVVLKKEA